MTNKTTSIGKAASIAVIIMAASNILSRLLGFVRIKILAHIGGAGAEMDAYAFAFIIPDMINHFLAGSALSITFIPILQKHFTKDNTEEKGWQFFSNLFNTGSLIFIVVILLSLIFTKQILFFAGENIRSNPETFNLTIKLTRIILPAQIFFFWGALLNGIQYSKKMFLFPALTPILYNVGIISGGLILFPYIGISGFSWGVLVGAFIGNVLIQIPGALRAGIKYRLYINIKDRDMGLYVLKTMPFILGLGLTFSNEFFLRLFGSYVENKPGAIATLDYAYKIMFMLVGLFGQSVAAGMYPFLSQLAVDKKYKELTDTLFLLLKRVGTILIPASMMLIVLSNDVIVFILSGGNLKISDALVTAKNFQFYLLGAYFCASVLVINRAYFALQKTYTPMILTSISVLFTIPIFLHLTKLMGTSGVAMSISISSFMMFLSLFGYWIYTHKNDSIINFITDIIKIFFISLLAASITYYVINSFLFIEIFKFNSLRIQSLMKCMLSPIPGLLIIILLFHITKILTFKELKSLIKRKKAT